MPEFCDSAPVSEIQSMGKVFISIHKNAGTTIWALSLNPALTVARGACKNCGRRRVTVGVDIQPTPFFLLISSTDFPEGPYVSRFVKQNNFILSAFSRYVP